MGSLLDVVVDELTQRFSRGDSPQLDEYLARYPHMANQLREVFEALQALRQRTSGEVDGNPTDHPPPLVGDLGDFRLLREIGRGGMGVVYEAEQLSLRRRVALKALPFAAVLDGRQLQRFRNEAQAAACLEHPNIVDVYAVGSERGVHYYAMRYIEGQTLRQLITEVRALYSGDAHQANPQRRDISVITRRFVSQPTSSLKAGRVNVILTDDAGRRLIVRPQRSTRHHRECRERHQSANSVGNGSGDKAAGPAKNSSSVSSSVGRREYLRSVARIGVQAAEALEHAHQMGVVHRDIKPSNMMLDVDGHLWITDFGLAMFEANPDLTMSGMILGTLRYMSPEQMRGDRRVLDHRTDVYSLGVTLYEMLALQPAFPESDPKLLLERIPSVDPPSPRRIRPDVPKDLATIVSKAISKDPSDRYRTAQELAEDLKCFLADRPIQAKRPTLWELVGKWMHRNTAAVGFWILLFTIATVGLSISTLMISREQVRTQDALNTANENHKETERQRRRAEEAMAELRKQARFTSEVAYASDIKMAVSAWQRGDSVQQTELLSRHLPTEGKPDLRGFEWYYLWQQAHLEHVDVIRGEEPLYCVCYSPDGKQLAVAGKAGIVRVFDTDSWQEVWSADTGQGEVNGLAYHPAGTQIVSAGDDGTLRIWDAASRAEILRIHAHPSLAYQVAYSPDGRELISCGKEPVIRVWDPVTGKPMGTFEGHQVAVEAITISANGQFLGSASSDGTTALWNLRSRRKITRFTIPNGRAVCCAFSRDSQLFAAGNTAGWFFVWNFKDDRWATDRVLQRGPGDGVQSITFGPVHPRGSRLLVMGDRGGGLRRWELTPARESWDSIESHWLGHAGRIYSAAISFDGTQFVSTGDDGHLRLWNLHGWHPLADIAGKEIALSQKGAILITASEVEGVHRWNLDSGTDAQIPLSEKGEWDTVAVSPDGELLAVGNDRGEIVLWNILEATEVWRWKAKESCEIQRLVFSPDKKAMAVTLFPHDNTVRLFDVGTGTQRASLRATISEATAFSPDGRWLAAGSSSEVAIYDVVSGQLIKSLASHADTITGLVFDPQGHWLASVGSDRKLVVWDLETGLERFAMVAHAGRARAIAVSPTGRTIATGGADGILRLWSVVTRQLLLEFPKVNVSLRKLIFSADGQKLISHDTNFRVWIYDGGVVEHSNPC